MGVNPGDTSDDVSVTFPDAVVRLLGMELRGVPRLARRGTRPADQPPLSFSKWDVHKAAGTSLATRPLQTGRVCKSVAVLYICAWTCRRWAASHDCALLRRPQERRAVHREHPSRAVRAAGRAAAACQGCHTDCRRQSSARGF